MNKYIFQADRSFEKSLENKTLDDLRQMVNELADQVNALMQEDGGVKSGKGDLQQELRREAEEIIKEIKRRERAGEK